jgi:beta-glucosidase-like glycosyl hydrolase
MKALTAHFSTEEIAIKAHNAGADLLLYGDHISSEVDQILNDQIPRASKALLELYRDKPTQRLDESVRRILHAKEAMGLFDTRTVGKNPDLNTKEAVALKETLFQEAITQLGEAFTPIDVNTTYVSIGSGKTDFLKEAFSKNSDHSRVVVSVRGVSHNEKNFGLTAEEIALCQNLPSKSEVIFCLFGSPYALSLFPETAKILVAYEEDEASQKAVLKILKGDRQAVGHLPISQF